VWTFNPLKYQDFIKSYIVLYMIGCFLPNEPNLCGGIL
jgi:hypothetical protein